MDLRLENRILVREMVVPPPSASEELPPPRSHAREPLHITKKRLLRAEAEVALDEHTEASLRAHNQLSRTGSRRKSVKQAADKILSAIAQADEALGVASGAELVTKSGDAAKQARRAHAQRRASMHAEGLLSGGIAVAAAAGGTAAPAAAAAAAASAAATTGKRRSVSHGPATGPARRGAVVMLDPDSLKEQLAATAAADASASGRSGGVGTGVRRLSAGGRGDGTQLHTDEFFERVKAQRSAISQARSEANRRKSRLEQAVRFGTLSSEAVASMMTSSTTGEAAAAAAVSDGLPSAAVRRRADDRRTWCR
jgi:hypothetical protein